MAGSEKEVRIHIDEKEEHSPSPTTGEAMYERFHIPHDKELFKEVEGHREDELVSRTGVEVILKEDEHFHTQKDWWIAVNGKRKTVLKRLQTFEEILELAYPKPRTVPDKDYKTTYKHAASHPHTGPLPVHGVVKIKNGTDFDVVDTTKS